MPSGDRAYVAGNFALRLDPHDISFLSHAEGGGVSADVLTEAGGPQHYIKKHLGNPEYEDLSVEVGLAMSAGLFDWIAASWALQAPKADGAVLALDPTFQIKSERAFTGALITETTIPALDAASKAPGRLTLRLTPETTLFKKGVGQLGAGLGKQKLWQAGNFRLQIAGLDCSKVSRIESFTVKRAVVVDLSLPEGGRIAPGKVDFPGLRISLAEAAAATWLDWHEDFVAQGHNDDASERQGSLYFLAPDLQTVLARIALHHLGIVSLMPEPRDGGKAGRLVATLYCEWMELQHGMAGP